MIPIWRLRRTIPIGGRVSERGITAIQRKILRNLELGPVGHGDPFLNMKKKSKFSKLATQLKKEGADDPKALAAYIGRKKLGAAEFMRRAAAGRKKAK